MKFKSRSKRKPKRFPLILIGALSLFASSSVLACGMVRLNINEAPWASSVPNNEVFDSTCDAGSSGPVSTSFQLSDSIERIGAAGGVAYAGGYSFGEAGVLRAWSSVYSIGGETGLVANSIVDASIKDSVLISRGDSNPETPLGIIRAKIRVDWNFLASNLGINTAQLIISDSQLSGAVLGLYRAYGYGANSSNAFGELASAAKYVPGVGLEDTSPYLNEYDVAFPFYFDTPMEISFHLQIESRALFGDSYIGETLAGNGRASIDASHTIAWNGVVDVTDGNGNVLNGWGISSESGMNYLNAAGLNVPEPGSRELALVGLIGLASGLYKRRAQSRKIIHSRM